MKYAFSTHSPRIQFAFTMKGDGEWGGLFGVKAFCVFVIVFFKVFAVNGNFLTAVAGNFLSGE